MCRSPNTPESIGLPVIPTNSNANMWKTPHNLPTIGRFGGSGNIESHTYNGCNMVPPYLGAVNDTNSSFVQQQPPMTNATAIGGSMHNYPSQTIYSQPQAPIMQNQIHYSQAIVHTSLTQNYTVQGPKYRVAYWQDAPPQIPPPVQADPKANVQPLMDSNMIAETIRLHFGIRPRPLDRLVYRKPYPNWIYKIPLSRGYKTPNFSNFLLRMENLQWNILAVYGPM